MATRDRFWRRPECDNCGAILSKAEREAHRTICYECSERFGLVDPWGAIDIESIPRAGAEWLVR